MAKNYSTLRAKSQVGNTKIHKIYTIPTVEWPRNYTTPATKSQEIFLISTKFSQKIHKTFTKYLLTSPPRYGTMKGYTFFLAAGFEHGRLPLRIRLNPITLGHTAKKRWLFSSKRRKKILLSSRKERSPLLVKKYSLLLIKKILPSFEESILSKRTNKNEVCGDRKILVCGLVWAHTSAAPLYGLDPWLLDCRIKKEDTLV